MRVEPLLWAAVVLVSVGASGAQPARSAQKGDVRPAGPAPAVRTQRPFCSGEYADDQTALAPSVRAFEQQKMATPASYCLRTTATYECLSYGADGSVKRTRNKAVAHGTAFGFRREGNDTLLMTNQHVAEWPAVTSTDTPVDGVPVGCKRVSDTLRIVDDEADAYDRDDIPLSKVVSDASMDVAIVRAQRQMEILPW